MTFFFVNYQYETNEQTKKLNNKIHNYSPNDDNDDDFFSKKFKLFLLLFFKKKIIVQNFRFVCLC